MIRFEDAIVELRPNAQFVCYGGNLEGLKFDDSTIKKPTQKEVADTIKALEAKETAKAEAKAALLEKLGITEAEAKLLLS
jgi:hypothetical protein